MDIDWKLKGKVVVVTGAARGNGEAIARGFAEAGAKLVLCDKLSEKVEAVARDLRTAGVGAIAVPADVSEYQEVKRAIETAVENFRRIDVLVNNAGVLRGGTAVEVNPENWDENFDINAKGCFYFCQLVARQMIKQREGGKIITISSVSGLAAEESTACYSASKAAVIMFTKVLAVELAPHKINVNSIAPGWVDTEMVRPFLTDPMVREVCRKIPLGRIARSEDLVGGALFLASHLSDYVTGHVLVIDGGLTVNITTKPGEEALQFA